MTTTDTFTYTGSEQTWTVPDHVDSVTIKSYGAGVNNGDNGGYAKAEQISVTPGNTLYVYVGGEGARDSTTAGGWNGGGDGGLGSGDDGDGEGGRWC